MSTSLNPQHAASEPFGQTGVRRYIFPILASASLTAMVLSLGMWLRSHYVVDRASRAFDRTQVYVSSIYGRILVAWGNRSPYPGDDTWTYTQEPMPETIIDRWQPSVWKRIGIEWRDEPISGEWGTRGGWVRIRWPFVAGMMGLLPLLRLFGEHRRRRALTRLSHGQCPRCGYDMRRSFGRCPECGQLPAMIGH